MVDNDELAFVYFGKATRGLGFFTAIDLHVYRAIVENVGRLLQWAGKGIAVVRILFSAQAGESMR
jgi:hypothetical protein